VLLSMTGYGDAHLHEGSLSVSVEIRSVNNRYLKLSVRGADLFSGCESDIESIVRQYITRGTITVNLHTKKEATADRYCIDLELLRSYHKQLNTACVELGESEKPKLSWLLELPGVVQENSQTDEDREQDWPIVEKTLRQAIEKFCEMRRREGASTTTDLRNILQQIRELLDLIEQRAPEVVTSYRERVTDRLNKALEEFDVAVDASSLIREVAIFTDRVNIAEEMVRLKSHLDQFDAFLDQEESTGRKLDFLTQELFREANTIGSKANDAEIAKHVVEMKSAIEKIREQVQNIE